MAGSQVKLSEKEWDIPRWKVLSQVAAIHLISKVRLFKEWPSEKVFLSGHLLKKIGQFLQVVNLR